MQSGVANAAQISSRMSKQKAKSSASRQKWVCLKIGYIPNEIAICYRDNDQQNHWVQWGLAYFQTHPSQDAGFEATIEASKSPSKTSKTSKAIPLPSSPRPLIRAIFSTFCSVKPVDRRNPWHCHQVTSTEDLSNTTLW